MTYSAANLRAGLLKAGEGSLLFDLNGGARSGAELASEVDRLAGARSYTRKVHAGAKVGLWYRNSFAAVEGFLATEWIGGTENPPSIRMPPPAKRRRFFGQRKASI